MLMSRIIVWDGWKSSKERLETDAKYRAGPMIHLRCDGHRN